MAIRILPGQNDRALDVLTEAANALTLIQGNTPRLLFDGYSRWANDQGGMLRSTFPGEIVDRLVFTYRYWVIQKMTATADATLLIHTEIAERGLALTEAIQEVRLQTLSWGNLGHLIIADTNVFVNHRQQFDRIDWRSVAEARHFEDVTVVVPMVVLRELDKRKRSKQDRGRASLALARISAIFAGSQVGAYFPELAERSDANGLRGGRLRLRIVVDELGRQGHPTADDEIIQQGLDISAWAGRRVTLATFDTSMAFVARQYGLRDIHFDDADLAPEVESVRQQRRDRRAAEAAALDSVPDGNDEGDAETLSVDVALNSGRANDQ